MTKSAYVIRHKPHEAPRIKSRLGRLDIELTERCPNDCIHCCINRPAMDAGARAREMTTAQVVSILDQAASLGCLQVRFTGGEPLLRPDFEELYLYARRLGMKVLLFTNGRLITPHLADLFARIPPLVTIEITVYGMTPESYEAVTGNPGSFDQFWRGVNLLLERQVPFVVKSSLLPQNRHELDTFEAWAKTIPWMTGPPSYAMNFDLRNRRDSHSRSLDIAALRLTPAETVAMLVRNEDSYRKTMADFAAKFNGPPGDRLFGCGAISGHSLCIDAYGRAQACMGLRAPELTVPMTPNAMRRGESVENLAAALERFQVLGEKQATNPGYLDRCARCFLKALCEQCPAKAWTETGTLDTPVEYLCEVTHAQARFLGWLGQSERAWEVVDWQERTSNLPDQAEEGSCADANFSIPDRG
jgi:radical SAM protein with 4Fe4S-binding SPASM domain